jgi:lipopolysaccharide transport protein LptA
MPSTLPDRRRSTLLIASLLLCLQPVLAAKVEPRIDKETPLEIAGTNMQHNLNTGTLRARDVTITQGPETTIRAAVANGRGLKNGFDNSSWELSGAIHIEFDDLVLEADAATVVFSEQRIATVHVQGKPARFTHQQKDARKNEGRASTIDYEQRTGNLRLAGNTWLFDGRNEVQSSALLYNLNDGVISNDRKSGDSGPVKIIIRPGKPPTIPTPRTPDRSTAQ